MRRRSNLVHRTARSGHTARSAATTLPKRPRPKCTLPPEVLDDAEVQRILGALSERTAVGIRKRALIALLFRTGLRLSHALSRFPKDLDLAGSAVRALRGKGGRSRVVRIDSGAAGLIAG